MQPPSVFVAVNKSVAAPESARGNPEPHAARSAGEAAIPAPWKFTGAVQGRSHVGLQLGCECPTLAAPAPAPAPARKNLLPSLGGLPALLCGGLLHSQRLRGQQRSERDGRRDSDSIPDGLSRQRRERFSPPLFCLLACILNPAYSSHLNLPWPKLPKMLTPYHCGEQQIPQSQTPSFTPSPPYSLTQHNQAQKELFLFTAQLGKLFHAASPPGMPGARRLQLSPGDAVPRHCPDFPVQIQNTRG